MLYDHGPSLGHKRSRLHPRHLRPGRVREARALAPFATAFGALLISTLFAKVHLWKPFFQVWGVWNRSFLDLGADALSWGILTLLVTVAAFVAMAAAWADGRIHTLSGAGRVST